MKTAKTNTTKDLTEELLALAQRLERRYEKAKADLLEAVQTNPAEALAWHGEDMAKAQEPHEQMLRAVEGLKDNTPQAVLAYYLQEVERGIERFFGSNSTSQFSNAVARARTEGLVALGRDLASLAR